MAFQFSKQKQEQPKTEHGQKQLRRPSAEEIYRQVIRNAKAELQRSPTSLAISGFAGGTFMGLSALGTAIVLGLLGTGPIASFCSRMFYPLGFIVVILGRAQLFTENTLYPVALVMAEKRHFWKTARLWALVLPGNVLGALAFSVLVSYTHALLPPIQSALIHLGAEAAAKPFWTIFWSGVVGGWIIAMIAWLVSGSHSISGSILLIWMMALVVGAGDFAHCIAGSCEVLVAVLSHAASWASYGHWLGAAVLGNICGGICMVTVLEYGQVVYGGDAHPPTGKEAPLSRHAEDEPSGESEVEGAEV